MGELASRVTGVMLDWRRPANVAKICRESAWHTLVFPSHMYEPDVGLYARFALGLCSPTECVLIQDDDILLPASTVETLVRRWEDRPDRLHGIFGRRPSANGAYNGENVFGECEIVLTRALVCSRKLLHRFFHHVHEFDDEQRDSRPYGNGEDLILSYVAGAKNHAYDLPRVELPANDAIHQRIGDGHWKHRTKLLRRLTRWLRVG